MSLAEARPQGTSHLLDRLAGDRARPKQHQLTAHGREHRGFQPDAAGPAVHGGGGEGAGLFDRVGEGGGAGAARAVGRGRGDGPADGGEHGLGGRMVGRPHGDRVQPRPGEVADRGSVRDRRHQRQGARPEGLGETLGARVEGGDGQGGLQASDMGDQGIELRPALGLEHLGRGARIAGVAGQAIDGLGRQDGQLAAQKGADGGVDVSAHAACAPLAPAFAGTALGINPPW